MDMDNVWLDYVSAILNGQEKTAPAAFVLFSAVAMENMVVDSVIVTKAGKVRSVMFTKTNVRFLTVVVMETVWLVFANVRQDGVARIVTQVSPFSVCACSFVITITTFQSEP